MKIFYFTATGNSLYVAKRIGGELYSTKMVKTYSDNAIRYAILESKDTPDNMGATVISFDKSSIKN